MNHESEYNKKQDDRIYVLEEGQKKILAILEPISDTYRTASRLGKWSMGILVFVSVLIGVILGLKSLVK